MFLNKKVIYSVFFFNSFLIAQSNEQKLDSIFNNELDNVVITATRTKRQLSSLPMPVTLVSSKQIAAVGSVRLQEILLEQTGINYVSDFGGSKGIQLQGMDAEYTLVLIDGLPVIGRTSGNLDLSRLSLSNIKQIEIVKGPSSALYGSEAMGGVINIITKEPTYNATKATIKYLTRFGAKDELDLSSNVLHKHNRLSLKAAINANSASAFDLSPATTANTGYPYQNFTNNIGVTYEISDNIKAAISQRYFTEQFIEPQGNSKRNDLNLTGTINHTINSDWKLNYSLYYTNYKTSSIFNNELSEFNQSLFRPEIKTQIAFKNIDLIGGIGANYDALDRTFFDGKETFNSQYVYAQLDTDLWKNTNVVIGARYDHFNKFAPAFSPKVSLNHKLSNTFSIKGSIGFGYKTPDFRQLFFNFRNTSSGYIVLGSETIKKLYPTVTEVQNLKSELSPESSIGYNLGFTIKPIKNLELGINLFRNDIKDLINTFSLGIIDENLPNTNVFTYENRKSVFTQGIEFDTSFDINNKVKIVFGYQYLDTGDKQELAAIKNGNIFFKRNTNAPTERLSSSNYFGLANRSKHTANAKLFYTNDKNGVSGNIRVLYRSKYALFDTNGSSGIIDNYDAFVKSNTQVNMSLQKKLFNRLSLQFGINNLFNDTGIENHNYQEFMNNDSVLQLGRTFFSSILLTI
ncbi:TonB-dependent receptor plug domain-containing protein [Tenacibaculum geojense]|uniref:TonB-dependent receptor plug domain-containing protein n=1 Tax=Tenacibaculum geojense TaxID=915352 RepID=A0ABW3JNS5_9FLAO